MCDVATIHIMEFNTVMTTMTLVFFLLNSKRYIDTSQRAVYIPWSRTSSPIAMKYASAINKGM